MSTTEPLEQRFKRAIDARKFNVFEITGFQQKPNLALMAGAAIGFRLAMDDLQVVIQKMETRIRQACQE